MTAVGAAPRQGLFRLPAGSARAIGLAVLAWLMVAALTVGVLVAERRHAIERAMNSASALSLVMEEHMARTFQSVDLVLAGVADAFALSALPRHDPRFRALMRGRLKELPYLRAIYVIGPDGLIIHDTDYPSTPDVSLADRDYFESYLGDPALWRDTSGPLLSRSDLGWFNAVTRRVVHEGRFAGVAVAAVVPRYFEAMYRRMQLEPGQVIELFHRDGRLVARFPADDAQVGQRDPKRSHAPPPEGGVYITDGPVHRLISDRVVGEQPLIVSLSQDMTVVLAGWRRMAIGLAATLLALAAAMALAVGLYIRQQAVKNRMRDRVAQAEKLEALGRLTGGVAHDFGNLLGIVGNAFSLVSHTAPPDPRIEKAVAIGQRAVARGADMIRQMLSFAKQQTVEIAPTDLNAVIRAATPLLQQAAGDGIHLVTQLAEPLARCHCDETQLEAALVNLIANARDAMQGQGRIAIETAVCTGAELAGLGIAKAAGCVALTVRDDGPGMSAEVLAKAFEPFFSTKGDAGTGLGLAQVYGFVRQVHGDARIDSAIGRGTAVSLFFEQV